MIREAREGDVGPIWAIEQQCFSDPWTIDQFLDVMKFPGYVKLVWEEEGEICGYIIGMVIYDDAEIFNVAVVPSYRRKGIGDALMDAFENLVKEGYATSCFLEVRIGNTAARTLYEKKGYAEIGVRKRYYPDGEDALLMKKTL